MVLASTATISRIQRRTRRLAEMLILLDHRPHEPELDDDHRKHRRNQHDDFRCGAGIIPKHEGPVVYVGHDQTAWPPIDLHSSSSCVTKRTATPPMRRPSTTVNRFCCLVPDQRRGGLVHDHHPRLGSHGASDGDESPGRDRQTIDPHGQEAAICRQLDRSPRTAVSRSRARLRRRASRPPVEISCCARPTFSSTARLGSNERSW